MSAVVMAVSWVNSVGLQTMHYWSRLKAPLLCETIFSAMVERVMAEMAPPVPAWW